MGSHSISYKLLHHLLIAFSISSSASQVCKGTSEGGRYQIPVLQLLVINQQTAEYFRHGFPNDEVLVVLAEAHPVIICTTVICSCLLYTDIIIFTISTRF